MTRLALIVVLPLALLSLGGVLIVDVRDGEDGPRLWVPVPLVLAQGALLIAPAEARSVELPDLREHLPAIEAVIDGLARQADFTLLEVRSRDGDAEDRVVVRKAGGRLVIEIEGSDGEQVTCRLPLKSARRMASACRGGEVRTQELLRALQFGPRGELVHVRGGGDVVRIRMI